GADPCWWSRGGRWQQLGCRSRRVRVNEVGREHADHFDAPLLEIEPAAEHRWIGSEAAHPEPVGQYRHFVLSRAKLLFPEQPTQHGPHAEELEIALRHRVGTHRLDTVARPEYPGGGVGELRCDDAFEPRVVPQLFERHP